MKKILIFILSLTCLLCFAMAACTEPKIQGEETPKDPSIVMMNGFNTWDDLILFDLNPTYFTGNWQLNRDAEYIVEGDGSWRVDVVGTKANQPNFKIKAAGMKRDITDVTEFGMWVYTDAEYEFGVIITAFAGDTVVCSPMAKVVTGANDLKFAINRALIAQSGKMITEYSIAFSGIKSGTVVYFDNFYAKTTTETLVLKSEIQEVINGINALSLTPERAEIEALIAKYNALSAEDKLCVSNADRLKTAIETYYLSDLGQAQVEDPSTLLYFDKPFGEVQVTGVTAGIGSYSYTTDKKYGEEEGSLRVDFVTSSTNWVTLSTSANTLIAEENIEFYVYNDSDQYKAICIAWNGPEYSEYNLPFYVIAPREWTKIFIKATDLTNSQVGQNGTIQICGLASMDIENPEYASARSPEGTMYFSSFIKKDDGIEVNKARTGEDANTLFFFDRELGLKQISASKNIGDIVVSEDVKFDDETITAVSLNDINSFSFTTNLYGYKFNDGDYVAIYVKFVSDNADYIRFRLGYYNGTMLANGEWALVIYDSATISSTNWFMGEGYNDAGDYKPDSSASGAGTLYLSKAKVYSKDQVKNLTTVDSDYEYNIGSTTFIGKANEYNKGNYNYNDVLFNNDWYYYTYIVNDAMRVYAKSSSSDNAQGKKRDTVIGLTLKDATPTSGKKIYVTAIGLGESPYMQVMRAYESGHFKTAYGTIVETRADGFVTWCFDISEVDDTLKYFRFGFGQQKVIPDVQLVTILDISVVADSAE